MHEEQFSPQDSLKLIDSMIQQAKNRFTENGFLYLLWGWLIFFCAIGHFILLQLDWFKHPELIWNAWIPAVIFQAFYLSKKKKKEQIKTYSETMVNYIWVCFGICMFVLSTLLSQTDSWQRMSSFLLMLYGMPTFLSGIAMQFKPLTAGGIACWVLAVLSVFLAPIYGLLLLALAIIIAWIIPGYLMRKKFKKENTVL
jgi:hypothetical protein